MTVLFENETDLDLTDDFFSLIKQSVEVSSRFENIDCEIEVSVTITDNEGIRKINQMYRDIDKATDVLSFPLLEFDIPGELEGLPQEDDFNMDTDELMLGDIIISYEKAREQAIDYNHSLEREIAFLTVHSMLHLLGYDHMDEEEEYVMFGKQDKILEQLNLKR